LTLLSSDPETTKRPSALNATLQTALVCPSNVRTTSSVSVDQIITLPGDPLSADPDTTYLPSGLNATLKTELVCPYKVRTTFLVSVDQIFTLVSFDPDTTYLPSLLNATLMVQTSRSLFIADHLRSTLFVDQSIDHIVTLFNDPVTTWLPSLLKAKLKISSYYIYIFI
jgi:hypothetical protein